MPPSRCTHSIIRAGWLEAGYNAHSVLQCFRFYPRKHTHTHTKAQTEKKPKRVFYTSVARRWRWRWSAEISSRSSTFLVDDRHHRTPLCSSSPTLGLPLPVPDTACSSYTMPAASGWVDYACIMPHRAVPACSRPCCMCAARERDCSAMVGVGRAAHKAARCGWVGWGDGCCSHVITTPPPAPSLLLFHSPLSITESPVRSMSQCSLQQQAAVPACTVLPALCLVAVSNYENVDCATDVHRSINFHSAFSRLVSVVCRRTWLCFISLPPHTALPRACLTLFVVFPH